MPKFGKLQSFDPAGRTATMSLPIGYVKADGTRVQSKLHLVHAGDSNKRWLNAVNAYNAKTGIARKSRDNPQEATVLANTRDRDLYPKLIIQGWDDVPDDDGNLVPFSVENAAEYVAALPQWIFDEVRMFAVQAANFVPTMDMPSAQEARDAAGN